MVAVAAAVVVASALAGAWVYRQGFFFEEKDPHFFVGVQLGVFAVVVLADCLFDSVAAAVRLSGFVAALFDACAFCLLSQDFLS